MTVFTVDEQAAIDRLTSFYNGNAYNGVSNPGGLAVGGHRVNEVPMMQDAAAVAVALARVLTAGANMVGRYNYTYDTDVAATDPTSGKIKFNNATLSSATAVYLSETNADAVGIAADIATWDDATSTIRGQIRMTSSADITKFAIYNITGALTDSGNWVTIPVAYVAGNGTFLDESAVNISFQRNGDKGDTGAAGPSFSINALTDLTAPIVETADYEAIYSASEAATRKVLASTRNARINRTRRSFNSTIHN